MRLRNSFTVLVAALGVTIFATACSSDSKSDSTTAAPVTAAATTVGDTAAPETTAAAPDTTEASAETTAGSDATETSAGGADSGSGTAVDIASFKFGPAEIDVKVGDTVTWTNSDAQAHTATASGTFDTGSIAAGATGTATFDTAGTYEYICSFHPFMHGTVVVS